MNSTPLQLNDSATDLLVRPRLSEVVSCPTEKGFDSFAVVNSNVRAMESVMRFASGHHTMVAIIGPSGWGKSHLLEAAAATIRAESFHTCHVLTAVDWIGNLRSRNPNGPLILDNVQDVIQKHRSRVTFEMALERRVRAGKPTLLSFTETKLTRSIRSTLRGTNEWMVATIKAPAGKERLKVVERMAVSEGLGISSTLAKILANRVQGNGRTLSGALKRLKLHDSQWKGSHSTLRALGILNLFLASNSDWDLREHIAECAKSLPSDKRAEAVPFDLALHTMLRVALLSEAEVAKFFRIEPAKAYSYSCRFSQKMAASDAVNQVADEFVHRVVATL